MSALDWKPHAAVEQCERAGDYQVCRQAEEDTGRNWYAIRFDDGNLVLLAKVRTKQIAKAVCADNWAARGAAPMTVRAERPDNYAPPPFEPSGDPEWDERARGGVDKS